LETGKQPAGELRRAAEKMMKRPGCIVLGIGSLVVLVTGVMWLLPGRERRHIWPGTMLSAQETGVVKSAAIWAQGPDGRWPPHLASLLLSGRVSPKAFVALDSPRRPMALPNPPPAEGGWRRIAADVDAHSDLIYTGADLTKQVLEDADAGHIIAVYSTTLEALGDLREVGFADAHVEAVHAADLAKVFAASNTARAKVGLPPFELDGPVPAASSTQPDSSG
jgi:hypothetical protein